MTTDAFAGLPAPITAALVRRGFESLTAVQQAVVSARSAGRDLRISSQTGSGKTVAIGLALADHFLGRAEATASERPAGPRDARSAGAAAHPTTLVIVPTRELAAQVREELRWLYADLPRVDVEVVTGGTSIMMERRALARGPALVVGTPGRLLDHMRNGAIVCDATEHVVLDEADQMLDMGFREELEAILEELPEMRSSHLVSATFPRAVLDLANRFQNDALAIEGTRLGAANADIQHIAYAIRRHETYAGLVNVLLMAGDERCLLFVNRRVDATELAEKLASDGFGAAPFSGDLAQAQRTRTLAAFRNGTLPILVSTEVAARGIDVPGISTVIHVDPPRQADAYTHRSGRTGRAGQTGRSVLFVTPPDLNRVQRMLKYARVEVSWQPIPTPEKVEKALRKRARRLLHEKLAEHTPEESQWMYAKTLLEGRDPVQVVATLLDLAKPTSARAPMPVVGFDPKQARAPRARDRREERRRPGHPPGRGDEDAPSRRGGEGFTRFFVSWGEESGATTGRLLSQVCRRGGIESDQVGPIEIAARVSFVGIANEVAADFEARARRPDKRDPGIVIKRAEEKAPARREDPGGAKSPARVGHHRARRGRDDRAAGPRSPSRPGRTDGDRRTRGPRAEAEAKSGPPAGPRGGRASEPRKPFRGKRPGHKPRR